MPRSGTVIEPARGSNRVVCGPPPSQARSSQLRPAAPRHRGTRRRLRPDPPDWRSRRGPRIAWRPPHRHRSQPRPSTRQRFASPFPQNCRCRSLDPRRRTRLPPRDRGARVGLSGKFADPAGSYVCSVRFVLLVQPGIGTGAVVTASDEPFRLRAPPLTIRLPDGTAARAVALLVTTTKPATSTATQKNRPRDQPMVGPTLTAARVRR